MVNVVVNGPSSWNLLVDLEVLPQPHPHMVIADGHHTGLGGTSAGKALGLARLGVPTTLRTVLGDDPDASSILGALEHPGLTLLPEVVPGPSEHHLNLMAADGGRVSIYLDVTGAAPRPAGPILQALDVAEIAVLDLAVSSLPLLAEAKAAGCEIWCDIHDYDGAAEFHRPFAEAADVLVVSADRLPDPSGFLEQVVAGGASLAVCTDGARGAVALSRDEGWYQVDGVPVATVADTNGAGDAFVVGLLAGKSTGRPLEECLRWASAAGALCVQSTELVAPGMTRAAVKDLARLVGCQHA